MTKETIVIDAVRAPERYDVAARFDSSKHFNYRRIVGLNDADNEFLENELVHMIPGMLEYKSAEPEARDLFPVYFANDPGATRARWGLMEAAGEAAVTSGMSNDEPTIEMSAASSDSAVVSISMAAAWSYIEIQAAQREGRDIDSSRVRAAVRAIRKKESDLAFDGGHGVKGLMDNTDITTDSAAGTVATRTATQNVDMFADFLNACSTATDHHLQPNILALPHDQYNILAKQRYDDFGDFALQILARAVPSLEQIVPIRRLNGAGVGGADVALCFRRDTDVLRHMVMDEIRGFEPVDQHGVVRVKLHSRYGGLLVQQPAGVRLLSGI
ncbi:MAG: DUF2184 domain-containing protein [Myxococcales bacterium FL481]|nr:MAG: DUF2184 domain-containing protein [Myxococcales bacterium FL481]